MKNKKEGNLDGKPSREKLFKTCLLIVVSIALLLDRMLMLVIVPTVSDYEKDFQYEISAKEKRKINFVNISENWSTHIAVELSRDFMAAKVYSSKSKNLSSLNYLINNKTFYDSSQNITELKYGISNIRIGLLLASKPLVQGFVGPFVGTVIDKTGYDKPIALGFLIIFVSSLTFAVSKVYVVLIIARGVQGIGTSLSETAGFAAIADRFKDDAERSRAQGIVLAVLNVGIYIAPPFGGFFHKYFGRSVPYYILSVMAAVGGLLMVLLIKFNPSTVSKHDKLGSHCFSICNLLLDPYIAICVAGAFFMVLPWTYFGSAVTMWMIKTMNVNEFQVGLVWLPAILPHLGGIYLTVWLAKHYPRFMWLFVMLSLTLESVSCVLTYFCSQFVLVALPLALFSFGFAISEAILTPMMANLVDIRHPSLYGSAYAIFDMSTCVVLAAGFILSDVLYQEVGFLNLSIAICAILLCFCPFLCFLRNVSSCSPKDYEKLNDSTSNKYET